MSIDTGRSLPDGTAPDTADPSGEQAPSAELVAAIDQDTVDAMFALGYLDYDGTRADESLAGVVRYDEHRAEPGYRFAGGQLLDLRGNPVHTWPEDWSPRLILPSGNTIALRSGDQWIARLSWSGDIIWTRPEMKCHHDIQATADGRLMVLTKEVQTYRGRWVEFDVIAELDAEGRELSRWSTWEHLDEIKELHAPRRLDDPLASVPKRHLKEGKKNVFGGDYDYYHTNSVQELPDTPLGKADPRFRAGNWIISLHHVNLVAIIDRDTKKIVWSYGPGEIYRQHAAWMLPSGNIIIFDNGHKTLRPYSRAVELDPTRKKIVWQYGAQPQERFYSRAWGAAQRLPNGNTLISDAANGRAFEVTPDKEIVWEWYNPVFKDGQRKRIYRVVHHSKEKIDPHLK